MDIIQVVYNGYQESLCKTNVAQCKSCLYNSWL